MKKDIWEKGIEILNSLYEMSLRDPIYARAVMILVIVGQCVYVADYVVGRLANMTDNASKIQDNVKKIKKNARTSRNKKTTDKPKYS